MPIAVTVAATTRSSSPRFRSRRSPGRACLPPTSRSSDALLAAARAIVAARRSAPRCTCCFSTTAMRACAATPAMIARSGVQFHWTNAGYRDFADFLASFSHDKRKKVKQDRRKVAEAGVTFVRKTGSDITAARLGVLLPLLRVDLPRAPLDALPHAGVLRAHRAERCPSTCCSCSASATAARSARRSTSSTTDTLWGRYWGTIDYVPGLHFEACYYQAIEFCLERGIARFEGGAQGLHKLARGLTPVATQSAHAIADPAFARRDRRLLRARARRHRAHDRTSSRSRSRSGRPATPSSRVPQAPPHDRARCSSSPPTTSCCRCRPAIASRCASTRDCASA